MFKQPHPSAIPIDCLELYKHFRPPEGYTLDSISATQLSDQELTEALHKLGAMPITEKAVWGMAYTLALMYHENMQEQYVETSSDRSYVGKRCQENG